MANKKFVLGGSAYYTYGDWSGSYKSDKYSDYQLGGRNPGSGWELITNQSRTKSYTTRGKSTKVGKTPSRTTYSTQTRPVWGRVAAPPPPPPPPPPQNDQLNTLSRQVQQQIDANAQQKAVYDQMIDDLNQRIEEAQAARATTGMNVIVNKGNGTRDIEQQTVKKIKPRKQLLAIEEEEDEMDTGVASLATGTGINLGI